MAVNVSKLATLEQLGNLANRTVQAIAPAFKSLSVSGNRVNFYKSTDGTGDVAAYFDLAEGAEGLFLDQAVTRLVSNFTWSEATYPGSTNPNLDNETVLVLGVKGDNETNSTVKYTFVNLASLIDTYNASDTSLTITDHNIKVNISSDTNNALTLNSDGLFVGTSNIDASGKIDKVNSPTEGNIPLLASDGTLTNSTITGGDVLLKVTGATSGNIAVFQSDGTIVDSGLAPSTATADEINAYFDYVFNGGDPSSYSGNGT